MLKTVPPIVATVIASIVLGACGGDDDETSTVAAAEADTASLTVDGVVECLNGAGVKAETQFGIDDDEYVGIDYSGDRTAIYVEESEDEAELSASLGEQYGETFTSGTVAVILAADPAAAEDRAAIESCIGA
jgi:hypothetical protein